MDPCHFTRINIANLALTFPTSSATFHCKIRLIAGKFSSSKQYSTIPAIAKPDQTIETRTHACFSLKKPEVDKILQSFIKYKSFCLKIEVYSENGNGGSCLQGGRRLGSVVVPLDLKGLENRVFVFHSGWVKMNSNSGLMMMIHLSVKSEPDPRFVFQFDGEPECSPQVFQVNGCNLKQPVFSCKFGFRNCGDQRLRTRASFSEQSTSSARCFSGASNDKDRPVRERKGWSITIHDLSGSPVAAASMVTPFVASPGSDRVSRSNPGAWLILRPGDATWKPWGRLEAWRDDADNIGFKFELILDGTTDTITLIRSSISSKHGGRFCIDINTNNNGSIASPLTSPNSSFDFSLGSGSDLGSGSWPFPFYGGFVMSSTVGGAAGRPEVEIGVQHVACAEDAAAFVALAAAMDLSVDACRSFSQKLRKELRQTDQE